MESSAQRRRGRFTLSFFVGLLVVALGAELAVRLLDPRLPEPLDHFSPDAQTMVHDLDVLADRRITSDVAFVGTSMVRRGIAANRVEGVLDDTTYAHNVALPGSQTPVTERWLLEEVVPRIHPRRVVWGVSSIDFNAGRTNKTIDRYDKARATERGWMAELDRALRAVAVSDHRDTLRDPYELLQTTRRAGIRYDSGRGIDGRGVWELHDKEFTPASLERMRERHRAEVRDQQLVDFEIGREELRAFRHTLQALRDQSIEVVVVAMPVPSGFRSLHPEGPEQFDQWRSTIERETQELGVTWLDLTDAMSDDDFSDYEHLWVDSAFEFTDLLAGRLQDLGW
jgi:hypothetical protein